MCERWSSCGCMPSNVVERCQDLQNYATNISRLAVTLIIISLFWTVLSKLEVDYCRAFDKFKERLRKKVDWTPKPVHIHSLSTLYSS